MKTQKTIIKVMDYASCNIAEIQDELESNTIDLAKIQKLASARNIGMGEAIEMVATHLVMTDTDFIF